MKIAAFRLLPALLIATATLGGCAATRFSETSPPLETRAARDRDALAHIRSLGRGGDWLVIRGYHLTDNAVAAITNAPFSHAAVLDLERDRAIEAEGVPGVHATPLAEFVAKSHRLMLIRPMWSDERSSAPALDKARDLIGRRYDFLGLVGLDIPDRYYCSELTLEIYRPFIRRDDAVPRLVEPAQLLYWGRVIYDTGAFFAEPSSGEIRSPSTAATSSVSR